MMAYKGWRKPLCIYPSWVEGRTIFNWFSKLDAQKEIHTRLKQYPNSYWYLSHFFLHLRMNIWQWYKIWMRPSKVYDPIVFSVLYVYWQMEIIRIRSFYSWQLHSAALFQIDFFRRIADKFFEYKTAGQSAI